VNPPEQSAEKYEKKGQKGIRTFVWTFVPNQFFPTLKLR